MVLVACVAATTGVPGPVMPIASVSSIERVSRLVPRPSGGTAGQYDRRGDHEQRDNGEHAVKGPQHHGRV